MRRKPRRSTAVNRRDSVYKYYPIDDTRSIAVMGQRCKRCRKITTSYCVECHTPYCRKHLDENNRCENCKGKRADYIF